MPSYEDAKRAIDGSDMVRSDVFDAMIALAHRAWEMPANVHYIQVERNRLEIFGIRGGLGRHGGREKVEIHCYPIRVGTERWDCYMGYGPISAVLAWRVEGPF